MSTRPPTLANRSDAAAIAGVWPVVQMPYHDDESIDWDTLGREADWLYGYGANGLVIAMVSEVLRLTEKERTEVTRFLVKHADGRGGVIASVGAESSYQACELTRAAEQAGASALMAVPPIAIGAEANELRRYYERIAQATTLPVIVQDASGYVGKPMSIQLQANLLDEIGSQIYFKPEATPIGPRLTALRQATQDRARIFEGTGGIGLVDSHRRGIVGTMPGADIPWAIVALWRALEAGDSDQVNRVSPPLAALIGMQQGLDAFLAIEKYLLVKQGVFLKSVVRGPVSYHLDHTTCAEVDRLFDLLHGAVERPPGRSRGEPRVASHAG